MILAGMGRGRKRASAGRKRQPATLAVAVTGGADRTAMPHKVLAALHRAAQMCRTRILGRCGEATAGGDGARLRSLAR